MVDIYEPSSVLQIDALWTLLIALVSLGGGFLLARRQDTATHRSELRSERRQVAVAVVEALWLSQRGFHNALSLNVTDPKNLAGFKRQEEAFDEWAERFSALQLLAKKVDLFGSPDMANLVRYHVDQAESWMHATGTLEDGYPAWRANVLLASFSWIDELVTICGRRDLGLHLMEKAPLRVRVVSKLRRLPRSIARNFKPSVHGSGSLPVLVVTDFTDPNNYDPDYAPGAPPPGNQ